MSYCHNSCVINILLKHSEKSLRDAAAYLSIWSNTDASFIVEKKTKDQMNFIRQKCTNWGKKQHIDIKINHYPH